MGIRNVKRVLVVWLVAFSCQAYAYVCARVEKDGNKGPALYWNKRNLTFSLGSVASPNIRKEVSDEVFRDSFDVWQNLTVGSDSVSCAQPASATDITFAEQARLNDAVGYDVNNPSSNRNLLVFKLQGWVYGRDVIGLTSTTYNANTGEILDADIEFNEQHLNFSVSDTLVNTDLKNAAVHEIGHFLGFDHSSQAGSTMEYKASPQETHKRDLHCDDVALMLLRYPAGKPVGSCDENEDLSSCGYCAPPPSDSSRSSRSEKKGGCQAVQASPYAFLWAVACFFQCRARFQKFQKR
jgi:hypothetical protein